MLLSEERSRHIVRCRIVFLVVVCPVAENVQILPNKHAKLLDYGFGRCLPYQIKLELPTSQRLRGLSTAYGTFTGLCVVFVVEGRGEVARGGERQ